MTDITLPREPTPEARADLAAELYGYMRHPQQSQWYDLPDDKMVYWLDLAAAVQGIFSRHVAEKDAEIEQLRQDKERLGGAAIALEQARVNLGQMCASRDAEIATLRERLDSLGIGEIVMMSEQRNKPGLPPRWCALASGRKLAAMGDTEIEARANALAIALPTTPTPKESKDE